MQYIGVDEVGRGCWAGPLLVVAAKQAGQLPRGLADSKVLSKKKRQALFYEIQLSFQLGEGWVHAQEINSLGLAHSIALGVERALSALHTKENERIIIDGNYNYCPKKYINAECMINADASMPIVSAASIYAKVLRDSYMEEIGKKFPEYHFEKHVGYGTKLHRDMLKLYGASELHRMNYKPLLEYRDV